MTPSTDLEARLRAFDPAVRRPSMPDSDVCYTVTDTPAGQLVLAATPEAVVACSYQAWVVSILGTWPRSPTPRSTSRSLCQRA